MTQTHITKTWYVSDVDMCKVLIGFYQYLSRKLKKFSNNMIAKTEGTEMYLLCELYAFYKST